MISTSLKRLPLRGYDRERKAHVGRGALAHWLSVARDDGPSRSARYPFSPAQISNVKKILGVPDVAFFDDAPFPAPSWLLAHQRDERVAWEARVADSGAKGMSLLQQLDTNGAAKIATNAEKFAGGTMVATRKAMQRAIDTYGPQTSGLTAGSADLTENTGVLLVEFTPPIRNRSRRAPDPLRNS